VFRAPSPLGPWTALGDANIRNDGWRTVRGQVAFVATISAAAGAPVHMIAFDEWMTGSSRAHMHQYWAPLEFTVAADSSNGSLVPIVSPLASYRFKWKLPAGRVPPPHLLHAPLLTTLLQLASAALAIALAAHFACVRMARRVRWRKHMLPVPTTEVHDVSYGESYRR
jgi:hypothetical protein